MTCIEYKKKIKECWVKTILKPIFSFWTVDYLDLFILQLKSF